MQQEPLQDWRRLAPPRSPPSSPQSPPSSTAETFQQGAERFGQQVQRGAQQFGRDTQQFGQQVERGAQQFGEQSQSWLCKNILPPRHDAGKAIAIAVAALIFFVVGAALGAWRSWIAIVLGVAAAVAIFVGVYIGAAKYDYNCQQQSRCAAAAASGNALPSAECPDAKPWWQVSCSNNKGSNASSKPQTTATSGGGTTIPQPFGSTGSWGSTQQQPFVNRPQF